MGGENDASVEDDARLVVAQVQVNVLRLHPELARRLHVVLVHLVRVVAHPDRLVVRKQFELVICSKVDRNIAPICCYNFEVLKASSQIPPVFKQLKLDKTNYDRVVQSQVLNGWWILFPAIFKVSYDQLLPGFVVVWRAKKSELFCGPVVVVIVPNVSETQTLNFFFAAKIHDETLLSSCPLSANSWHRFQTDCQYPELVCYLQGKPDTRSCCFLQVLQGSHSWCCLVFWVPHNLDHKTRR